MWNENSPTIVNAELVEDKFADVIFEHHFLGPITPSKRKFKRNFLVERKDSFYIAGIQFHSYKDIFWDYKIYGTEHYNGNRLELVPEPWNKYDENAIAIKMLGSKLGYIERDKTGVVWDIMTQSKKYQASFDCSSPGLERIDIVYLKEFHNTYTLPYQSDVVLKVKCHTSQYKELAQFIKGNVGHTISFGEGDKPNLIAIWTDMQSIIGYIDDIFIAKQYKKTPIAGFIENASTDDKLKMIEINLRLLMKKSAIHKNYVGL